MVTLQDVAEIGRQDRYLAVVSTLRSDATIQSSLVCAGVLAHPVSGIEVVGFVTYGPVKLANLRARPQVTVTFRAASRWAAVEGRAEIIGPDDPCPGFDAKAVSTLLRTVFQAAGGTHDDWDTYDATMAEQRRAAVLITASRLYSN